MTCNMARKLKNVENETQTLFHLEYVEKTEKTWKMRHKNCLNWNMEKNSYKRGQ